jgi:hypothetical protein
LLSAGALASTLRRQYLYLCTSKASKLRTLDPRSAQPLPAAASLACRRARCAQRRLPPNPRPPPASLYVSIRKHTLTYVYVSVAYPRILAHSLHTYTSAYESIRQHTSAYVYVNVAYPRILAHPLHTYTSAYVSIRQHTSAYVYVSVACARIHADPLRVMWIEGL